VALERYGLEIVRVASVDFSGNAYEELRVRSGDLELKRRTIEFDQRLRDLLSTDKMQQFKTEQDLEQYVLQLAQEKGIGAEHRNHEIARLKQVHRHELEGTEVAYQMLQETKQAQHALDIEYAKHATGMKIKKDAWDFEKDQTDQALRWRAQKDQAKAQARKDMIAAVKGASIHELLASTDDPREREALLAYEDLLAKKQLTPQQILAMDAARNPAAAEALARMSAAEQQAIRSLMEEQKRLFEDSRARDERMFGKAVDGVSGAAKPASGPTTVINK
jgi:hypothetical protein